MIIGLINVNRIFAMLETRKSSICFSFAMIIGLINASHLFRHGIRLPSSKVLPHFHVNMTCAISFESAILIAIVEMERFELLTPCLQGRCSPNWATPPLEQYPVSLSICNSQCFALLIAFALIRRPPTLPYRLQHSTIGRLRLNHRVRDGNGCVP